jgi:hypothetical protein
MALTHIQAIARDTGGFFCNALYIYNVSICPKVIQVTPFELPLDHELNRFMHVMSFLMYCPLNSSLEQLLYLFLLKGTEAAHALDQCFDASSPDLKVASIE